MAYRPDPAGAERGHLFHQPRTAMRRSSPHRRRHWSLLTRGARCAPHVEAEEAVRRRGSVLLRRLAADGRRVAGARSADERSSATARTPPNRSSSSSACPQLFDAVILSFEVGVRKFQTGIYRDGAGRGSRTAPADAVFVDDQTFVLRRGTGARHRYQADRARRAPSRPHGFAPSTNGHTVITDP